MTNLNSQPIQLLSLFDPAQTLEGNEYTLYSLTLTLYSSTLHHSTDQAELLTEESESADIGLRPQERTTPPMVFKRAEQESAWALALASGSRR